METERLKVLEMLESGEINADEALALLAAIDSSEAEVLLERQSEEDEAGTGEPAPTVNPVAVQRSRWARFWVYPLMAGGAVLIIGSLVMALVYATDAARGWLVCGWLPMTLGLLVMLLAWWSRRAKWLHVRILEGGERKMAVSFPLPLAFSAWALRLVKPFVPRLRETGVDELIMALRASGRDEPISIDVRDDKNGEQVQVYIG
jgi:hypothetical protein